MTPAFLNAVHSDKELVVTAETKVKNYLIHRVQYNTFLKNYIMFFPLHFTANYSVIFWMLMTHSLGNRQQTTLTPTYCDRSIEVPLSVRYFHYY